MTGTFTCCEWRCPDSIDPHSPTASRLHRDHHNRMTTPALDGLPPIDPTLLHTTALLVDLLRLESALVAAGIDVPERPDPNVVMAWLNQKETP